MRQIIKDRRVVNDFWLYIEDDNPLVGGNLVVSLDRWRKEKGTLLKQVGKLGLKITNTLPLEDILDDLQYFDLLALEFPSFSDGRAYTQARLLRERYAYKGEIRATGDILRDQLFFMERCGFNAFEVRADKNIEDALKAFGEFTITYQPAADGLPSAFFAISAQQSYANGG